MTRALRTVHLVLGLTVGLVLVSAGLSGSVLVWRHEIDELLHPELLRVRSAGEALPVARILEVAREAFPGHTPSRVQLPRAPDEPAEITTAGAEPIEIYIDPYRGTVLGSRGVDETFANALFHWHSALLSGTAGERVMGGVAILLVLLVATGLVVWWPGLRRIGDAVAVKWRANWKRVNFDLHRAVGFWSTAFLLLTAVTGSSLVFHDQWMAALDWISSSERVRAPAVERIAGVPDLPADEWARRAGATLPEATALYISPPASPAAPAVVRMRDPDELHPNGRSFVFLHPQTGAVLAVDDAVRGAWGTRAYNVLYPLHIGAWGGIASRLLQSALGLLPLLLFVSGFLMWLNRTGGARRVPAPPARPRSSAIRAGNEPRSRNRSGTAGEAA